MKETSSSGEGIGKRSPLYRAVLASMKTTGVSEDASTRAGATVSVTCSAAAGVTGSAMMAGTCSLEAGVRVGSVDEDSVDWA